MEAIILAAGVGSRLRPLTDRIPKALVEVAGVTMLERVARRVVDAGARRIVINTHHHAEQIETFVRGVDGFGVEVRFSRETGEAPLETGGGIKAAADSLELNGPVLVHNVDILTDLPIPSLVDAHDNETIATLAVADRETRSPILLDDLGVVGVRYPSGGERIARAPRGTVREAAFCGISVISPELPALMTETGAFSVIPVYLRLIGDGRHVGAWDAGDVVWTDIGTHEQLAEANRRFAGERDPGALHPPVV
ncbi:MAG TPA: nucleotidyltransferase family protein [Longimicrobiales bacterium]|nr:nucleotidyltransferase family protein [Longimicrobiales bacterium]